MFKRLKERLVEEANKLPVTQHAFSGNAGKSPDGNSNKFSVCATKDNAEDFVISESSSIIVPHSSSDNFSIADEECFLSDQNSPQKKMTYSSAGSELHSIITTPVNKCAGDGYQPNVMSSQSSFVPTTDIESEVEEPPTLNLEDISKEQLLTAIGTLKARLCKYKNKYSEVVLAYKCNNEEKRKLEHTLTEIQDRTLRRMAELREQYQLEQKAKADLEGNLRMDLDEKESKISALKTQITLLKEGQSHNDLLESAKQYTTTSSMTDVTDFLSPTDESSRIEEVTKLHSEHEMIVNLMKERLEEMTHQQESSDMSMAEIKQNMHKELELKEDQLKKMKEEINQLQATIHYKTVSNDDMKTQYEAKIKELQVQLETVERTMEEDKQLHISVSRKKSDAVVLIQKQHEKKITALEKEWNHKFEELQLQKENAKQEKAKDEEELLEKISQQKAQCFSLQQQLKDKCYEISQLKEENLQLDKLSNQLKCAQKLEEEVLGSEFSVIKEECKKRITSLDIQISDLKKRILELKQDGSENDYNMDRIFNIEINHEERIRELSDTVMLLEKSREAEIQILSDAVQQLKGVQLCNQTKGRLETCECKLIIEELNVQIEQLQHQNKDMEAVIAEILKTNNELCVVKTDYEKQIENFSNGALELTNVNKLENENSRDIFESCQDPELMSQQKLKDEEFQALKEKEKTLLSECCDYRESIDMLKGQVKSLQDTRESEVLALNNTVKQLKQQSEKFKAEEKEIFQSCEFQYKAKIEQLDIKIQQLQDENQELEIVRAEMLTANKELDADVADYEKQIEKFRIEISELKKQIKKLEDDNFQNISKFSEKKAELLSQMKLRDEQFQEMMIVKAKVISDEYKESLEMLNKTIISLEQSRDSEVARLSEAIKLLEQENCQLKDQREENEMYERGYSSVIDQLNDKVLELEGHIEEMEEVEQKCNEMNTNILLALEAILNRSRDLNSTSKDMHIVENIKFLVAANDDMHLGRSPSHFIEKGLKLTELSNQDDLSKDLSEMERPKYQCQEISKGILLALEAILHHFQDFDFIPGNAHLDERKENKLLDMEANQSEHIEESYFEDGSTKLNTELSNEAYSRKDLDKKIIPQSENEDLQNLSNSDHTEAASEIQSMQKTIQHLKDEVQFYTEKSILSESAYNKLQNEYEQKFLAQQRDMQNLLNDVQMELTSKEDNDLVERLNRNGLEIAALRLDICEKDRALEEIREHYELIMQERDTVIKELKSRSISQSYAENDAVSSEPSDWDDTWVVPEETCENVLSISGDEAVCDQHLKQIETLKEELDKCNSEIKDLKILLHLSPPQPLESESHYFTTSRSLPEPTEMEYLKNILFQYMMGTETEILAKVIAAVLKFSEIQTKMIIEKEKAKSIQK